MVREPELVDNFMTRRVGKIDENSSIRQAQKLMQSLETRILVITRDGKPVYILEDWKTWGVKMNKKIKDIKDELEPAYTVPSGTLLPSVMQQLRARTAIIINDKVDEKIIGILSASDLFGKAKK